MFQPLIRFASLHATALALVGLNAVLLASWAVMASSRWPLGLTVVLALVLAGTNLVLLRALGQARHAGLSAPSASESIDSMEPTGNPIDDETTGLHQRWYLHQRTSLEERIVLEAELCSRYEHSMAVVVLRTSLMDLAGSSSDAWQKDAVEVARRAAGGVRTVDLSAAIGPLEFAMCLVRCDKEGAQAVLRRLAARLSGFRCEAGVAVYPDDDCQPAELIDLARSRSTAIISS